jgi:uncharacterized protein YndB with AHSA1/START domain
MATIRKEVLIDQSADKVFSKLKDPAQVAEAFPEVLTACDVQGDVRTIEFADGHVVQERIITVDPIERRIVYAVQSARFVHHSASMQCVPEGEGRCRFIWVNDFLPADAARIVAPLVDLGAAAFQKVFL